MTRPASERVTHAPRHTKALRVVLAAARSAVAALGLVVGLVWLRAFPVLAASATPNTEGDTRSSGQGPGLVGAPLAAIAGVIAIGLISALLTIGYVRVTASRSRGAAGTDRGRAPAPTGSRRER
jgi:pheromone shutdown protein TraB